VFPFTASLRGELNFLLFILLLYPSTYYSLYFTMDEIAPEYDVVVLGTGMLLHVATLATPPFTRTD
jgi:hypothetical protein